MEILREDFKGPALERSFAPAIDEYSRLLHGKKKRST